MVSRASLQLRRIAAASGLCLPAIFSSLRAWSEAGLGHLLLFAPTLGASVNFWRTMLRLGAEGSDRTPEDKKGAKIIVAIGLCILAVGLALHVVHNLNSYLVAAVGILFVLIGIYTYF